MNLNDFDFSLPEELIALRPARPRTASRLLVSAAGVISDRQFEQLSSYLRPGDRLVLNDTKVLAARLTGQRTRVSEAGKTTAKIEVTLLSPDENGNWLALAKPAKRIAVGEHIEFGQDFSAQLLDKSSEGLVLKFNKSGDAFDLALSQFGQMPLPPYIVGKRATDQQDNTDYQTVFARHLGAVAAPTASLHFDDQLLAALVAQGVAFSKVTLHVGAGTFLPVKTDDIDAHKMHSEWGYVSEATALEIAKTRKNGGRVIPVGTTALRLIETAARSGGIQSFEGDTDIFIKPGFEFNATDGLITNFHLPKSTLLMLVSALIGMEQMRAIYAHAIEARYRFFSYGDSSLLLP